MEERRWTTLRSENLIDSKWLKVRKDEVALPNQSHMDDFYVVTLRDAACIVALDTEGNLILKQEYRYPSDRTLIELPAGAFEEGEKDGLAVAKRELREETGYTSEAWQELGATIESSAKIAGYMHIYLALECKKTEEQSLDPSEDLCVLKVPFQEAVDMVMENTICCNSSAHGILKAACLLKKTGFVSKL